MHVGAVMARRAIWSGSISFGLVNVPVRMYSAIDEQDVRFHLLHSKDDSRIGYEKICKKEGKPVPDDEIVKGYEVSAGEYVYATNEAGATSPLPVGGMPRRPGVNEPRTVGCRAPVHEAIVPVMPRTVQYPSAAKA